MMTRLACLVVLLIPASTIEASSGDDIKVAVVRVVGPEQSRADVSVIVDVSWTSAWRNDRNRDAAWLFFKVVHPEGGYVHARVSKEGHRVISEGAVPGSFEVSNDQTGLFLSPAAAHEGDVSWRILVRLDLDEGQRALRTGRIEAFGIEMVQVPGGPFTLGEPSVLALEYGAFFRSDDRGEPDGLIRVTSEASIAIGPEPGALNYREAQYVGDRQGPVPAAFPAGFDAFYIMKHEVTQGQYVAFLNTLPDSSATARFPFDIPTYSSERGTIERRRTGYIAEEPGFPLNFIRWDDGLAYAAWAGLRPLTELEFTKAARGPTEPTEGQFPWGTSSSERIASDGFSGVKRPSTGIPDEVSGASYFGVMNLAGATWERVISIGSPDGRAFRGSHGTGMLTEAHAANPDWPHTWSGKAGHGYRGGGYYGPSALAHEFNPYSPVAFRRYGGWSGADPGRAYGFRAGRTQTIQTN